VRALRRVLPFVLALSLVVGFLSVRPPAVGAYNGVAYSSNSGAVCVQNNWCAVVFQVWGGADQWDYVRVVLYKWCYGNSAYSSWEGGVNNGYRQVRFWMGQGCYSSYAAVWYYDLVNNVWIEMQW
jgi:hypothetical protein